MKLESKEVASSQSLGRSLQTMLISPPMPQAKRLSAGLRVMSIDVAAEQARAERIERTRRRLTRAVAPVLDGFLLLEACGCEFPDEGHAADVSGLGAGQVAETDLEYFPRLALLDCSDNQLPLAPFGALQRIKELRFAANGMRDVGVLSPAPGRWSRLALLDLSYNALGVESVAALAVAMPVLRELDLTGNGLAALPSPSQMGQFRSLERLVLERNELRSSPTYDDPADVEQYGGWTLFAALSSPHKLRDVQLAHNRIAGVPDLSVLAAGAGVDEPAVLGSVVALGLAHNAIERESDIMPLTYLPKLELLALYGNPLLGPTGEDLFGECVQRFAALASEAREGWTERELELTTEAPRKRPQRGTQACSTQSRGDKRFRNLAMTRVTEPSKVACAASFRARGNARLNVPQLDDHQTQRRRDPPRPPARPAAEALPPTFHTALAGLEDEDEDEYEDDPIVNTAALLARAIEPDRRSDPAKLQSALNSLKFALDHPITSHTIALPTRRGGMVPYCSRPTQNSVHGTLPRRKFELKAKFGESGFGSAFASKRQTAELLHTNALREIETVLDAMNENVATTNETAFNLARTT